MEIWIIEVLLYFSVVVAISLVVMFYDPLLYHAYKYPIYCDVLPVLKLICAYIKIN